MTANISFIDVARDYSEYKAEIDDALQEVLTSGSFILGPKVLEVEKALAKEVGVAHCVSCSGNRAHFALIVL